MAANAATSHRFAAAPAGKRALFTPAEDRAISESLRELRITPSIAPVRGAGRRAPMLPPAYSNDQSSRLARLRRYVVMTGLLGPHLPGHERVGVEQAGYSSAQIEAVDRMVADEAVGVLRRRTQNGLILLIAAFGLIFFGLIFLLSTTYFDNLLLGTMTTCLTFVSLAPVLLRTSRDDRRSGDRT